MFLPLDNLTRIIDYFSKTQENFLFNSGYIREMIAAFPETVSWDVFNEIFAEKRRLRDDPFLNAHGIDLIAHCLQVAKSANPAATLVINDYNLECAGTWCGSCSPRSCSCCWAWA